MDLSVGRLRQIVAAITERRWLVEHAQHVSATARLRTICSFIACTVPAGDDGTSPLLDAAHQIGEEIMDDTETRIPHRDTSTPEVREILSDRPKGYEARETINPPGSFEAFTALMGGKPR